ncbi:CHAT domain-containing protein [Lentzea sp. NPDC054927]
MDNRMELALEWDRLVERARRLDGFHDFLRPPRLEDLVPRSLAGPLVVVNISPVRCDALIIRDGTPSALPLGGLTSGDLLLRALAYLQVQTDFDEAIRNFLSAKRRGDVTVREDVTRTYLEAAENRERGLADVTAWLWDMIAEPVLTELGITTVSQNPSRLWWCPTGLLSLLPLHAAGHHAEGRGRTVLDRVVSSYTPTVRALRQSQERTATSNQRMLVVAVTGDGEMSLESVARDRDLLTQLFGDSCTVLQGAAAIKKDVRDALVNHGFVHFSCHGVQDLTAPSKGGLVLQDGTLTVTDVVATEHHGEFAFLSACKTAVGGTALADEAITLAAALHYTGYRHVIGTMWSVYDKTAGEVADVVYRNLTATGAFAVDRSAQALHDAVSEVRRAGDGRLSTWTPFTHTGP